MTFKSILNNTFDIVLNPLIELLFAVALLIFVYGIVQFISSEASDAKKRSEGKNKIVYGLVGMLIMFSAYGIIRFIIDNLGIPSPGFPL